MITNLISRTARLVFLFQEQNGSLISQEKTERVILRNLWKFQFQEQSRNLVFMYRLKIQFKEQTGSLISRTAWKFLFQVQPGIIIKSLDPLRAKKTFKRKKLGHTMVSAIKASSVIL